MDFSERVLLNTAETGPHLVMRKLLIHEIIDLLQLPRILTQEQGRQACQRAAYCQDVTMNTPTRVRTAFTVAFYVTIVVSSLASSEGRNPHLMVVIHLTCNPIAGFNSDHSALEHVHRSIPPPFHATLGNKRRVCSVEFGTHTARTRSDKPRKRARVPHLTKGLLHMKSRYASNLNVIHGLTGCAVPREEREAASAFGEKRAV